MTSLGLIATGGTIASRRDPRTNAVRSVVPVDELLETVPDVGQFGKLVTSSVASVNGWNMTPELMLITAREAERMLAEPAIRGVVVTHGTDTIEETAFLLDVTNHSDKPIVLACAMRGSDEFGADGPRNLRNALCAASSDLLTGYGATICISDQLHAARWAIKADTEHTSAIKSPERGPVARVTPARGVQALFPPPRRWNTPIPQSFPRIPVIKTYTGMDADVARLAGLSELAGLIIEGTGLGNVPGILEPAIEALVSRGVPVVIATRVLSGGTAQTYGGPGGGASLRDLGALFAGHLTAAKARLLLGCLIARDGKGDYEQTRRAFDRAVSAFR